MRLNSYLLLALVFPGLLFGQFSISDNFDDNATDATLWLDFDPVTTDDSALQEINNRLEFTGSGTSTHYRYSANASYDSDFEVIFKVLNSVNAQVVLPAGTSTYPSIGVEIYPAGQTTPVLNVRNGGYLFSGAPSRDIIANFFSANGTVLNPASPEQPLLFSPYEVGIRLYYESDTSVITVYYDSDVTNGFQWTQLMSMTDGTTPVTWGIDSDSDGLYNEDFGITAGTGGQLEIGLYGSADNNTIISGQMYIDDFTANQVTSYSAPSTSVSPAMIVDFDTQWNGVYTVEKSTELDTGPFTPVRVDGNGTTLEISLPTEDTPANTIIGTGESFKIIDFTTGQQEAFYRVTVSE
jgi:hypothetical protein